MEVVSEPVLWYAWALGPGGLYYATDTEQVLWRRRQFKIRYLAFDTGRTTVLFRKEGIEVHWFLTVSPDEKWILFAESRGTRYDLSVVENFR